ncbi:MAG: alpha-amylase family glycosyl hydrolase, partial [Pseudomonadota bacterium]
PENIGFLKRFRALLDEYPDCAAVGEVGDAQRGLEIVAQYTSGNDKIHMCYAFEFLSPEPLTPKRVRDVQEKFGETAPQGWSCWAFSNHDVMRHASRWADHVADREAYLKMTTMLILTLRGSVCLYQGEELGLSEAVLDFEDLQDPYGKRFWPNFRGRDGCRTPMAWSHNEPNAGFSNEAPWLPVPPEHLHLSVNSQEGQSDSLLEFYREFLQFRRLHPEFIKGSIRFHEGSDAVVVFEREHGGSSILVAINMGAEPTEVSIPNNQYEEIGPFGVGCRFTNGKLELPPFGGWLAKIR